MSDTLIDLFRHGKVDGPAAMYGATDVALHADGWQQLQAAVKAIPTPEVVVSSPKQRCRAFADQFANGINQPLLLDERLQEFNFGDWDGVPFSELFGGDNANPEGWVQLKRFSEQPAEYPAPNGEAIEQVHARCGDAFQQLVQQHRGKHVAVFCHAAVIRLILAHLLPVDWRSGDWFSRLTIGYASRTRIRLADHPDMSPVVECIGWLPADVPLVANPEGM